ncbi:AraC family transcriptional regulator [Chitinilyticum litopenaei]|uniref:AraC family transcriptional regulator n=1 Tax=Chitinilyticum litopenaei TaxID=1121276 RepID=UPI001FE185B8|nr:helix-turn-helix transcriptional regulator [Chitinilyticum litopenaei]
MSQAQNSPMAPIADIGPPPAMADGLLIGKSETYPAGTATIRHTHPVAQLLFAIEGVMKVETPAGQWVAPPSRAIWIPPGEWHEVHMLSRVQVRSVYVRSDAVQAMPGECAVLAVTPLLRELLLVAVQLQPPHAPGSRAERLIHVLLDELQVLPTVPLALPVPDDPLLRPLCEALRAAPDDARTTADWAARLGIDTRTLQRRFQKATGMSFGEWRRQARLLFALQQLAAGRRVLDVALDAGYASPSAFTAMFRRQFGATPSAFFAVAA